MQTNLFFFLSIFILLTFPTKGQSIDELQIIPGDPIGASDVVSVIATAWHPTQDCPIEETEFFFNQDTITVVVHHELGLATAICNSVDTTAMGSFAPGTYKVEYVMISGVFGTPDVTDTAYTSFTVQAVNSISNEMKTPLLSVFPNPAKNHVTLKSEILGQVNLFNLLGEEVNTFLISASPMRIDLSNLKPGIYFLNHEENLDSKGVKVLVH